MSDHAISIEDAPVSRVADVPGDVLASLAALRMSGLEWRVVVTVLLSPEPMSARQIATALHRPYGPVKRVVRGLVEWRIFERLPAGFSFQVDRTRWGPPRPRSTA